MDDIGFQVRVHPSHHGMGGIAIGSLMEKNVRTVLKADIFHACVNRAGGNTVPRNMDADIMALKIISLGHEVVNQASLAVPYGHDSRGLRHGKKSKGYENQCFHGINIVEKEGTYNG